MNYNRPELVEHLAREYVLGTLQGPARRRFVALMRSSRQIALAVAQWEERLTVMAHAPVLVQPPATTWQGIEARLFPRNQES
jgi:anti-sigma-K factor RskA